MPDFRVIPSIEQLRHRPAVRALEARFGHAVVVDALRAETETLRRSLAATSGDVPRDGDAAASVIERGVSARIDRLVTPSLGHVINATGVIIHTNLGRAPLSRAAAERVAALARGYTNLEYDLARGTRGTRDVHAERLLC